MQATLNFFYRGSLEEQYESFGEVLSCFRDSCSLTRNINLWAKCDIAVTLAFDNSG